MSGITAFTCRYENNRIVHDIPSQNEDTVNAVSFFIQSISENSDDISEKEQQFVYYLCLKRNTVFFVIRSDMSVRGYIYEFDQILDSWKNADDMICRLISDESPDSGESEEGHGKAADAVAAFRGKFRNVYSPQPFCLALSDDGTVRIREISRRHEEDDDLYNSFIRSDYSQICIEYKDMSGDSQEEDHPFLICRPPEVKKKSFLQIITGKKDEAPDLKDLLYLRYEDREIPLNSFAEAYTVSSDQNKLFYRLDKLKKYTE